MNKERRKVLADISGKIEELKALLEDVKGEEEEYLYYMPENFTEKRDTAQSAVDALDTAIGYLDDAVLSIEEGSE